MESVIKIRRGDGPRLARVCGVSYVTVWKALGGHADTPKRRRVRHVALKDFGGVEYVRADACVSSEL